MLDGNESFRRAGRGSDVFGAIAFAAGPQAEAAQAEGTGHGYPDHNHRAKRDEQAGKAGENVDEGGRERAHDGVDQPEDEVEQSQEISSALSLAGGLLATKDKDVRRLLCRVE